MKPELSIIIGALREEKRIGSSLNALADYLEDEKFQETTEVIIVIADGGDRTKQIVEDKSKLFKNLKIIEPGKPVGKGRDIQAGMLSANGKIRLYMDADLATPLRHINTVMTIFKNEKADIVIGTRKLTAMHHSAVRRFISIIGNLCFLIVGGFYSPDTQCGFKAFTEKASNICFKRLTRMNWSFDMELLTIAHSNQLEVQQIAINDWKDVPNGSFNPNLKSSWQFFKDLVRIFTYRLSNRYRVKI